MGWGRSWGRFWGGSSAGGPFSIASARASASNAVRVTFTRRPLFVSPVTPGDASRLLNWTLERTDAAQKLTLIASRGVQGDPLSVEFIIAQRWASALAEYTITGSALLRSADGQVGLTNPDSADFLGAPASVQQLRARSTAMVDVANFASDNSVSEGSLRNDSDGDYLNEQGLSLLKKVIYRSIFWKQGEALHLAGVVFGEGVEEKGFHAPVDLRTMQSRLQLVVARQPEVMSSSVRVTQYDDGRLELSVRGQTKFGPLDVDYKTGPDGQVFY